MKKIFTVLATGLLMFGMFGIGNADVLTFDDLTVNYAMFPIPNGYGGLNWYNLGIANAPAVDALNASFAEPAISYYSNGIISGTNVAYNFGGLMGIITDPTTTFDFIGAYFTSAWDDGNILTVNGYDNGVLADTTQLTLNTSTPQWLNANFQDVNEVTFSTSSMQFAMDNFTNGETATPEPSTTFLYLDNETDNNGNGNETVVTPEPSTFLLFGAGIAGFAFSRKRMKA